MANYQAMKESIDQLAAYVLQQMEKEKARERARARTIPAAPQKKKTAKRRNVFPVLISKLGEGRESWLFEKTRHKTR